MPLKVNFWAKLETSREKIFKDNNCGAQVYFSRDERQPEAHKFLGITYTIHIDDTTCIILARSAVGSVMCVPFNVTDLLNVCPIEFSADD